MPAFILNQGTLETAVRFNKLDEFTQGYISTAFWLARDESDQDESGNPNEHPDWSLADLAEETWTKFEDECREFQESFADDLAEACDNGRINGYDMERAGTDFWLTRNHHGAGFWDRGLGDVGDKLTANSHPYGETDLYVGDDGKLYF